MKAPRHISGLFNGCPPRSHMRCYWEDSGMCPGHTVPDVPGRANEAHGKSSYKLRPNRNVFVRHCAAYHNWCGYLPDPKKRKAFEPWTLENPFPPWPSWRRYCPAFNGINIFPISRDLASPTAGSSTGCACCALCSGGALRSLWMHGFWWRSLNWGQA